MLKLDNVLKNMSFNNLQNKLLNLFRMDLKVFIFYLGRLVYTNSRGG